MDSDTRASYTYTPAPGDMAAKCTTYWRTCYQCNAKQRSNHTLEERSPVSRYGEVDDNITAACDASTSYASDSSSNNQSCGRRCPSANGGSYLEDGNRGDVHPLNRIESVQLAKGKMGGTDGKWVCTNIPCNVFGTAKVICYGRNGCGQDRCVLSAEVSHGQAAASS